MGQAAPRYDLLLVGTGFASTFFLREFLRRSGPRARVLVLERGIRFTHAEYLERRGELDRNAAETVTIRPGEKPWGFFLGFGGGSNCWWANTPRMIPADFEIRSRFGVGQDWPIRYADLEPYYCEVEDTLRISGPGDHALCPRSRPYPEAPHVMSDPDRAFQQAYPGEFFAMPSARARTATAHRPACCGNGTCQTCPVDAKYTVLNEAADLYADPRVTLRLGATVDAVDFEGGRATGVAFRQEGREERARGDLIALGANAIFNAHILLRSGLPLPALGKGLVEQVGTYAVAYLRGVNNFQGSTSRCGHGYMLHRDADRSRRAAGLILTHNTMDVSGLRMTRGKWRQILGLTVVYEDLRDESNRVELDPANLERPLLIHPKRSAYADRGIDNVERDLGQVLSGLPVESFEVSRAPKPSEVHILGTTVMGTDPATSVVDRNLVCHGTQNLLALGSGAFPTAAPANPTLTLSALTLWAADRLLPGPRLVPA